jgi:hypothetical protein
LQSTDDIESHKPIILVKGKSLASFDLLVDAKG